MDDRDEVQRLQDQFESVSLRRGAVFLLSPADAVRFIDACEQQGFVILGIDGFRVFGDKIQPWQEDSFDLEGTVNGSCEIARTFITDRMKTDLWFEVVAAHH